ncbi:MAG TPA: protein kinase [Streptosporangiaceae bacterium]|nr:protein kinase [Streptosporangiaceae bacterium]
MKRQDVKNPARIGPYTVVRLLGAGGMGRVYLAISSGGHPVAVKVIDPDTAADPGFRPLFRVQVEAARAVSDAFTAPVIGADIDGPTPWLATAYIPAPALQTAVEEHGPLPEPSLRVLGAGLAEALEAIHQAGLIHRDLKPSNVLRSRWPARHRLRHQQSNGPVPALLR